MKTTVTTPTLTPRIVNIERSLFVRTVSSAIQADSLMSMKFIRRATPWSANIPVHVPSYSALNASIGSNFAARQAGHNPLIMPTIDDMLTPRTADQILKSSGKPISRAINQATPNPVRTPQHAANRGYQ